MFELIVRKMCRDLNRNVANVPQSKSCMVFLFWLEMLLTTW